MSDAQDAHEISLGKVAIQCKESTLAVRDHQFTYFVPHDAAEHRVIGQDGYRLQDGVDLDCSDAAVLLP